MDGVLACESCSSTLPPDADTVVQDDDGQLTIAAVFTAPLSSPAAAAAAQRAFSALVPGDVLCDRYEIVERLGQGGMGSVYKAMDQELERFVALKTVRPDLASNAGMLRRLKQEILLARKVTHPNVIRIHDIGVADGLRFITMEYFEGSDLGSHLYKNRKLGSAESTGIVRQICDGLAAAHKQGVIHRDLKPQNVLINERGEIRILDFGLARSVESPNLTRSGMLVGTPNYMSPEQATGDPVDVQSDIYAVGLMWYEMLTGALPFKGETSMARLVERTVKPVTPPGEVEPDIPQHVSDVIMRCLEIDPACRYGSVTELIGALRSWDSGTPGQGVPRPALGLSTLPVIAPPTDFVAVVPLRPGFLSVTTMAVAIACLAVACLGVASFIVLKSRAHRGPDLAESQQSINPQANELILEGRNILGHHRDQANVSASLEKFREALNKDGNAVLAWTGIADGSLEMLRITRDSIWAAKAYDAARQAQSRNSNLPEVHFALGSVYVQQGKAGEAVAQIKQGLAVQKDSDDGYMRLGKAYLALNKPDEAISAYKHAVELSKYSQYTHDALAKAYLKLGRNHEALKEFEQELDIRPNDASVHNAMGVIYSRQSRWDKALEEFKLAASNVKPSASAYSNLGSAYFYLGRYPDAIRMCQQAIAINPNSALFMGNLADAYRQAKQYEKAQLRYTRAIELASDQLDTDPKDAGTLALLALYYARKGGRAGVEKGEDYIQKAREIDARNNELMYDQAIVLALDGKVEESCAALKEALNHGFSLGQAVAEPDLARVRALPSFPALLKTINS